MMKIFFFIFTLFLSQKIRAQDEGKVTVHLQNESPKPYLVFEGFYGADVAFTYPNYVRPQNFGHAVFNVFFDNGRRVLWGLSYESQWLQIKQSYASALGFQATQESVYGASLLHGFGLILKAHYKIPFMNRAEFFWKDSFIRRRLTLPQLKGALMTWAMTLSMGIENQISEWVPLKTIFQLSYGLSTFTTLVPQAASELKIEGISPNALSLLFGLSYSFDI